MKQILTLKLYWAWNDFDIRKSMKPSITIQIIFVLLLAISQIGCSGNISAQNSQDEIKQGIKGKVVWLEGNQMPRITDEYETPRQKGEPVQREVYIYELTNTSQVKMEETFYTKITTPLVKKVQTDKNGNFKAALEEGKYSVFVMEEQGLWANIYDGEGNIMPVEVNTGKVTSLKIEINYKAAY